MRRVRLEKLWTIKNCQTRSSHTPIRASRTRADLGVALVERRLYFGLSRGRCVGFVTGPCAFCGSIEHVSAGVRSACILPIGGLRKRHYYRTSGARQAMSGGLNPGAQAAVRRASGVNSLKR